jgi:ABC-2 type transport system ATP-binding protein
MMESALIETSGLTKVYRGVRVVDTLDVRIPEGEVYGLLGPNGAGKSTTLLMLLGLTQPSEGRARVCGLDPTREARRIKQQVGYLPENVGFYGELTAEESLAYIAGLNGLRREEATVKIRGALATVGLPADETRGKRVDAFSRGMKQRLGIAEVLLKEPRVLLLDEPTLGLDPDGARRIIELVERLNREQGITVVLSSHRLEQVQRISDRVGIMIRGKLAAEGTIGDLAGGRLGVEGKAVTLEEIYMSCSREDGP